MGARKLSYRVPLMRGYKEIAPKKLELISRGDMGYYFYSTCPVHTGLPNRHESTNESRYGFNGMEKDDETHNVEGSSYDFVARIYDSRVARWLSVDPLEAKYPYLNPYNFVANSPLMYIDPDGKKIEMRTGVSGATNTNKGELREDLLKKIKNDKNQN